MQLPVLLWVVSAFILRSPLLSHFELYFLPAFHFTFNFFACVVQNHTFLTLQMTDRYFFLGGGVSVEEEPTKLYEGVGGN